MLLTDHLCGKDLSDSPKQNDFLPSSLLSLCLDTHLLKDFSNLFNQIFIQSLLDVMFCAKGQRSALIHHPYLTVLLQILTSSFLDCGTWECNPHSQEIYSLLGEP